ncbi:MAG: FprA family A-type flavoprotein [Bacteroidaceae bacterium]|nr:FprA family A-type flavoprotein [Bacteroidaceae bacterium]
MILPNIHYVGVNDRTKHRFEGLWRLPQGISYNSYVLDGGSATALIDTVEADFFPEFLQKLRAVLGDRPVDFLVVNHMEPDHSGAIALLRQVYPKVRIVGNAKTLDMVQGYYGQRRDDDVEVKQGDTLQVGDRTLQFHLVPMLHWPETMVTFDAATGTLFTGDAFGCYGALNGAVLDRDMDTAPYLPETERYYATILGKYGTPVQQALKRLAPLPITAICPTHGPVWTGDGVRAIIDTYDRLSSGRTQEGVVVCYGSMYGHTRQVAEAVAEGVAQAGVRKVIVHNLSVSKPGFVLADVFRYRGLAIGSPTYNGGLFPVVADLVRRLHERDVKNHDLALFGGYTWGSAAPRLLTEAAEAAKMRLMAPALAWKQAPAADTLAAARQLGHQLGQAVRG